MGAEGQLSNPRGKLETLSSQGSRGDRRGRSGTPRAAEPAIRESDEGPNQEKRQLSNPSPPGSTRQSQRRLKPTDIDHLLDAYTAGDLVNDIAARFGVSRTTVIGHVTRRGLPRRSDQRWSATELQVAATLYADGHSLAAVGARFDIHAETVRNRLRRSGVQIRTRRGWS